MMINNSKLKEKKMISRKITLFLSLLMVMGITSGCNSLSSSKNNISNSSFDTSSSLNNTSSFTTVDKLDPVITPRLTAYNKDDLLKIDNGPLPFRLYVPEDYDGNKYQYPLLIFLHGAGERGNNNTSQLKNAVQNLFNDLDSPIYQSISIFPQCPKETDTTDDDLNQWVDTPWSKGNYSNDEVPESNDIKAVLSIVENLKEEYSINNNRIYVMGLSMGGFGTWNLLMNHTELFAGAVPICGGADITYADKLKNMPIYTIHGTGDTTVPYRGTREMVKALRNAGSRSVIYDELKNFGHNVWDYASTKEGIMDWLFSQNKKNHTDVDNDGLKKYIFEAEAIDILQANPNNAVRFGNTAGYNSGESGTGYLGDFSSAGDKYAFSITSNKDAKAKLSMRMGARKNSDFTLCAATDSIFSSISLNDIKLNIDQNLKFNKTGVNPDYYIWEEKNVIEVNLKKGENKFVFTTNGKFLHWDYMALTTDANLTRSDEINGHKYTDWLLTKSPTTETNGIMYRYCDICASKEELCIDKLLAYCSPNRIRNADEYLGGITSYSYNNNPFYIRTNPTGKLKNNIIQAESGQIRGSWDASRIINISETSSPYVQLNTRKGVIEYELNSSEEATVNMIFSLAANKTYDVMLTDAIKLSLNGKPIALNDTYLISKDGSSSENFKDVDFGLVDFNKGKNTLTIEILGNFNFNFDYINLKSVSTID